MWEHMGTFFMGNCMVRKTYIMILYTYIYIYIIKYIISYNISYSAWSENYLLKLMPNALPGKVGTAACLAFTCIHCRGKRPGPSAIAPVLLQCQNKTMHTLSLDQSWGLMMFDLRLTPLRAKRLQHFSGG